MKRAALFTAGIFLATVCAYAQNNLDSVICKYLVKTRQIEKIINTKSRIKEGMSVKSTNYFMYKKPLIRLSDAVTIQPVIFGCYRSHSGKHLLIQYTTNVTSVFYFYGAHKLLNDMEKLKRELLLNVQSTLNDEDGATLINYLSLCYL